MHHQSPLEIVRRRLTSFYVINIIFIHGDFTQVIKWWLTRAQVVNRKCVYVSISYMLMLRMILPQEVFVCFVNLHYNESWGWDVWVVLNWAQTELLKSGPGSRTLGRIKTTYWLRYCLTIELQLNAVCVQSVNHFGLLLILWDCCSSYGPSIGEPLLSVAVAQHQINSLFGHVSSSNSWR